MLEVVVVVVEEKYKRKITNKTGKQTNKQKHFKMNDFTYKIVLLSIYHNGNSWFIYIVMKCSQETGSKIGSEEIVEVETLITL